MRNRFTLYINGIRADIDNNSPILFTYTMEELTNPTVVKNSFSKQLTLRGTPNNNIIFRSYYRPEAAPDDGAFNPAKRLPFKIVTDGAIVVESGYVRLDSTSDKGGKVEYKITLFGGLGSFLYNLQYGSEGQIRDLSSLRFFDDEEVPAEISMGFTINKDTVKEAWDSLINGSQSPNYNKKWDIINFAPCYNGIPDNFDAKHALVKAVDAGLLDSVEDEEGYQYGARDGYARVELPDDMNEWEVKDMRSYHQRPVVSVKELIRAISNPVNNGGFNVVIPDISDWMTPDPFLTGPYYNKTWMTLMPLHKLTVQPRSNYSSGSHSINLLVTDSFTIGTLGILYDRSYMGMDITLGPFAISGQLAQPQISYFMEQWVADRSGGGLRYDVYANAVIVEVVLYDEHGNIIGASPVMAFGPEPTPDASIVWDTQKICEIAGYTPIVASPNNYGQYVPGHFFSEDGATAEWRGGPLHVELNYGHRVANRVVYMTKVAFKCDGNGENAVPSDWDVLFTYRQTESVRFMVDVDNAPLGIDYSISYVDTNVIRSGSAITKEMLFSGTMSPAEFLLSFCKRYRLYLSIDAVSKTVYIEPPKTFFRLFGSSPKIDISELIARDRGVNAIPLTFNVERFTMSEEDAGAAYTEEYNSRFTTKYGQHVWKTGYEFNANAKNIFETSKFKTAPDVCSRSLTNLSVANPYRPAVFLNSGLKYELFGANPNATTELYTPAVPGGATIVYYDERFKTYDKTLRTQLHGPDGKCLDAVGVLLFLDGSETAPGTMGLSDDVEAMYLGNNEKPCWILDAGRVSGETPVFPVFRRGMYYIDPLELSTGYRCTLGDTLDFGKLSEMDAPGVNLGGARTVRYHFWRAYLSERYRDSARVITLYVRLDRLSVWGNVSYVDIKKDIVDMNLPVCSQLFRFIMKIDGMIWVLNKILDYNMNGNGLVKCEFVKVKNFMDYR